MQLFKCHVIVYSENACESESLFINSTLIVGRIRRFIILIHLEYHFYWVGGLFKVLDGKKVFVFVFFAHNISLVF